MTSDDPPPVPQQVSDFAVPDGSQAGFLISPKRFLKDMVIPSITAVWTDLDKADIEVAPDNKKISMKAGKSVKLPDITTKNDDTYTPVMSDFALEIMGDEIKIDMHTDVEVSTGIHATCTSTNWFRMSLGKNKKGQQVLKYKPSRTPVNTHGHYHDEGITILKDVLIAIAVVLALLSMVVDEGAGPGRCSGAGLRRRRHVRLGQHGNDPRKGCPGS